MARETKEQIVDGIGTFIDEQGRGNHGWYVGITDDPDRRFGEHKATNAARSWRQATSHTVARAAEKALLQRADCRGGTGGGDEDSDWVYAYKITATTVEST